MTDNVFGRDVEEDPRSILRWFVRGATKPSDVTEIVIPEGPATFVIGERWLHVGRGQNRTVMVEPGVRPRLATEADVVGGGVDR